MELQKKHLEFAENINLSLANFFKGMKDSVSDEEEEMKYKGITIKRRPGCLTWYARFRRNGKVETVGGKTQKECLDNLKKALAQVVALVSGDYTFGSWYSKWHETFKKGVVTVSTEKEYKLMLSYLSKNFINKKLDKIGSIDIKSELDSISAPRQRQKTYEWLKGIFEKAHKQGLIRFNPVEELPKPKYTRQPGHALTVAEVNKLIEECSKEPKHYFYIICVLEGLRKGEARALRKECIDFDNGFIEIKESINQYNPDNHTKTPQSHRKVPIFEKTKKYLLELIKNLKDPKELLFDTDRNVIDRDYKSILQKAGLPVNYTIKDLRHTFITRCQEVSIPEHIIQGWVGHVKGSLVTSNTYTHITDEASVKFKRLLDTNRTQF